MIELEKIAVEVTKWNMQNTRQTEAKNALCRRVKNGSFSQYEGIKTAPFRKTENGKKRQLVSDCQQPVGGCNNIASGMHVLPQQHERQSYLAR